MSEDGLYHVSYTPELAHAELAKWPHCFFAQFFVTHPAIEHLGADLVSQQLTAHVVSAPVTCPGQLLPQDERQAGRGNFDRHNRSIIFIQKKYKFSSPLSVRSQRAHTVALLRRA